MRLINLQTLELQELNDHELPQYAILSHTWEHEEVDYSTWQSGPLRASMRGYGKILGFRDMALSQFDCQFGWVDTCCINKTSSAELTEAINSMYNYYAHAVVCIAYLSDITIDSGEDDKQTKAEKICRSRWMTRGWCLQELIAPSKVGFYDSGWKEIASMSRVLAEHIHNFTGIPRSILLKRSTPRDWSVAQRMSWAAQRQTTRVEDQAYCLLGLFHVNLPLIYGEGSRAFTRLQEEIIRSSTDHSILVWNVFIPESMDGNPGLPSLEQDEAEQLLAPSPAYFANCNQVVECYLEHRGWVEPYEMTNVGLGISLPLMPCSSHEGVFHAVLNCCMKGSEKGPLALIVGDTAKNDLRSSGDTSTGILEFRVLHSSGLEPNDIRCSSDHLGRISIIEEEDLHINPSKQRFIIVRDEFKSAFARFPLSLDMGSDSPDGGERLKLVFEKAKTPETQQTVPTHAMRTMAFPQDEWDKASSIWSTRSNSSVISFSWPQYRSHVTFLFEKVIHGAYETPFRLAVFESLEPVQGQLQGTAVIMDDLKTGQPLIYQMRSAVLKMNIERFYFLAVTYKVTVTVAEKQNASKHPLYYPCSYIQRLLTPWLEIGAVQHRGKVEEADDVEKACHDHCDRDDLASLAGPSKEPRQYSMLENATGERFASSRKNNENQRPVADDHPTVNRSGPDETVLVDSGGRPIYELEAHCANGKAHAIEQKNDEDEKKTIDTSLALAAHRGEQRGEERPLMVPGSEEDDRNVKI